MDIGAVDAAITALDVAEFWENGYAVLHNMYTADEVEALRRAAYATNSSGGDLLVRDGLREVITDGRLIRVARKLLGTEEILYAGDSSVTINSNQLGWHKDNTDRVDPNAPDWDGRYTQLRFGIYCQDHLTHTGGLNLRVGSHNHKNLTQGECLYMQTVPGDLAVWSMRITHSGNGMLLKDPEAAFPTPSQQKDFAPEEVAPTDGDRIAVFAHLGAVDSHGQRYADYLKTRTYMVNHWRKHPYTDEVRRAAQEAGLVLRDMPAEVIDDPTAGLKEKWEPFPYDRACAVDDANAGSVAAADPAGPATAGVARTARQLLRRTGRRGGSALRGALRGWRQG